MRHYTKISAFTSAPGRVALRAALPKRPVHGFVLFPDYSVAAINAQVRALAPALNSATLSNAVSVVSSSPSVPVDLMSKTCNDSLYLFAVAMRNGTATATFTLNGFAGGTAVDVIGEDRTISLSGNQFTDAFTGYGVHLYRISTGEETQVERLIK